MRFLRLFAFCLVIAVMHSACSGTSPAAPSTVPAEPVLDEPRFSVPPNQPSPSVTASEPDSVSRISDPPTPDLNGAWLPDFSDVTSDDSFESPEEIDCEEAEELADWGEYEAADIADYCDLGPDPGELPDEFDWDR